MANPSCTVVVRGFDFGTTQQQIESHMSIVGAIEKFEMVDEGSARVTYSIPGKAKEAVAKLQQSRIVGNNRYIDVLIMDPQEFLAARNVDPDKAEQFLSMSPEMQQVVMARGTLATARDPTAVLVQRMRQATGNATGKSFNSLGGQSSLDGKRTVLVRGFDFGTTDAMIENHMSSAGAVLSLQRADEGSVCVAYSSPEEAKMAVATLQSSKIQGNKRYIDVLVMDPADFLAERNVDIDKAEQFYSLTLEQQQAVMARGTLATARDPTAVLVQRMQQVKGVGKSNYGPAQWKGSSGKGQGPYGGGGKGEMAAWLLNELMGSEGGWGGGGSSWWGGGKW